MSGLRYYEYMSKKIKKFVIIDGNALLHRAWHALPPLTTKDGILVNAVYGFASIMLNIIKDLKPDYGIVAFDPPGKTFRHKQYKEYKATRQKQPDELYEQIPLVKEVATHFGFSIDELEGYEADDVIGTLSVKMNASDRDIKTIIVTGDMDALQLVNENIEVYTIRKGISDTITYDINGVKEKFGFGPEKVVEYKALAGDSSDNIPGVAGVGDKTAKDLLAKFSSVEDIYKHLEKGGDKIKESTAKKLLKHKKEAFLSKELATIETKAKIKFSKKELLIKPAEKDDLLNLFSTLEFRSLLKKANDILGGYKPQNTRGQESLFSAGSPDSEEEFKIRSGYFLIDNKEDAQSAVKKLNTAKALAVDTETDGLGSLTSPIIGFSLCAKEGEAYYVTAEFIDEFKDILENEKIEKYGHNIKYDIEVFHQAGVNLDGVVFDTRLAAYILNPGTRGYGLDNLAFVELGHEMISIESLIGPKGKKQTSLKDAPLKRVADYAAEDADYTFRLKEKLEKQIKEENLEKVFYEIEMPTLPVLVCMEEAGVKIDANFLNKMSKKLGADLANLEKNIYKHSGFEFNVNSPKQLKEVLFGKLGISTQGVGKTKTGFSTAAGQLEKMRDTHPIIPLVMEHRELAKLKNTYLDALPKLVNPKTGRVHTSFNQTVASTGRLSSSDPNLQNIPIRTELGRSIRKAFVADKGNVVLSADYSQIELRVAADMSKDKNLIDIFNKGHDIHTTTASFVHNIPMDKVTPEVRRTAKEVNFGVLYGMGVHGLSSRTGIPYARAKEFIDRYFGTFSGLKKYLDKTISEAGENGFVKTKYGRKLNLPDINSGVAQIKAAAERLATNMPIQGTAADIMKIAMIKIFGDLAKISSKSRILMQVHDELVFEVPRKDVKKVSEFIKEKMESAVKLSVPLVAEVSDGDNWEEAH